MFVKVGQMPGQVNDYALADGATVKDALAQAGLDATNFEVRVSGTIVTDLNTTLRDNAIVLLTAKIKGNGVIYVKAGEMPGQVNTYAVESGTKVAEVLTMAGLNPEGKEIRMSGTIVDSNALVTTDNAIILLTAKIKGNK